MRLARRIGAERAEHHRRGACRVQGLDPARDGGGGTDQAEQLLRCDSQPGGLTGQGFPGHLGGPDRVVVDEQEGEDDQLMGRPVTGLAAPIDVLARRRRAERARCPQR